MDFQKEKQKGFHAFAADVMAAETTPETTTYQSVISTVYSLIEDNKLDRLHETLKADFPEYWHPEETKEETVAG